MYNLPGRLSKALAKKKFLKSYWHSFLNLYWVAIGSIFLISWPWSSGFLWFAVAQNLRHLIAAIIGIAVADFLQWALGSRHSSGQRGSLRANSILAAIAVSWLSSGQDISLPLQCALIIVAAMTTSTLAAAVTHSLRNKQFPALVWGYSIFALCLFLLLPKWLITASVQGVNWTYPVVGLEWVIYFFKSLGVLLYLPDATAGFLIAIAILIWSRTMFAAGVIGWLTGVVVVILFQNIGLEYNGLLGSHNYFTSAMMLSTIIYLPSRNYILLSILAGAFAAVVTAIILTLFTGSIWAFLPIPAGVTVWVGIAALEFLGKTDDLWRNNLPNLRPEEAWWRAAYWNVRAGRNEPLLAVPVTGPVQILQAFNGKLSHRGQWQHALDFQPAETNWEDSTTLKTKLVNRVYSPAAGNVIRARSGIQDNKLGTANYADNWGNHVVVNMDQGGWFMLAHLQQGSLTVFPGTRLEIGSPVALLGNSGRSLYPHLHMQAQMGPDVGSSTVPFRLANYFSTKKLEDGLLEWNSAAIPEQGSFVSPALDNPQVTAVLLNMAPGTAVWQLEQSGKIPRSFQARRTQTIECVEVTLDSAGRHLLNSKTAGLLVASIGPDAWRIVDMSTTLSPLLKIITLGAPSLPFAAVLGTHWSEPAPLVPSGFSGLFQLMTAPFEKQPFKFVQSRCITLPDYNSKRLKIETRIDAPGNKLPKCIIIEFESLKGMTKISAKFDNGTLTYTLMSFAPQIS